MITPTFLIQVMKFSKYTNKDSIHFLPKNISSSKEAIQFLAFSLSQQHEPLNQEIFEGAVLEREKIVSTGIGMGIALPHARLDNLPNFYVAVGIHKEGLDWHSLDQEPVHIIFLIAGPENQQTAYLKMLSLITTQLKEEPLREKLLSSQSSEEVMKLIENWSFEQQT
jgi:nitrogen PTS system EIIA component